MGTRTLAMSVAVILAVFASSGRADESLLSPAPDTHFVSQVSMTPEAADGSTWVLVAPYGWLPAMRGNVGVGGLTSNVDVTLGDVVDHLDDLNGAFMGHVEVGKNQFGLIFDGMLMKLSPEKNFPSGASVRAEISSTLMEGLSMLRVIDTRDSDVPMPRTKIDVLAGARYYQVSTGLRINPAVGPSVAGQLTKDWVDLIVGSRAAVTVADGLDGFIRADFGGFGIGTSSKLSWNLIAGGEYACPSMPGSSIILGYRLLSIDERQKSGPNEFVYDVTMQGPFTAFAFRF
jgi:hypothetical protein